MYQCFGKIQGEHPIFMPKESVLAEKLIEKAHILTIHQEKSTLSQIYDS